MIANSVPSALNLFRFINMVFVLLGQMDPEVTFHSIGILSNDFGEIITSLPVDKLQIGKPLFTLKEGSEYRLKLTFTVLHNIVSGLTYTNAVWKGGVQGLLSDFFLLVMLLICWVLLAANLIVCLSSSLLLK